MASMNGTFTIEFCAEDRDRIDRLTKALEERANFAQFVGSVDPAPESVTPQEEKPAEVEPAPEDEQPEPPTYTAAEIQAKVQKLAAPATGKREAVKRIVTQYAKSVSGIPEDKYPEVMERLTALEEGRA